MDMHQITVAVIAIIANIVAIVYLRRTTREFRRLRHVLQHALQPERLGDAAVRRKSHVVDIEQRA